MAARPVPPFYWPLGQGDEPSGRPSSALGHDGRCHLVAQTDGSIRAVDATGVFPTRYVNQSAEKFQASVNVFDRFWQHWSDVAEGEVGERVSDLMTELAEIDSTWTRDPDAWWSVILEQVREGLI